MIRILEIPMLSLIIGICAIHAHRFHENIPISKWFHFWWGFAYGVPAASLAWRYQSWWLLGSFTIERFVFYNPVLNLIRQRKFFYIVADNSKPGFWDKIEVWWANFYPYIWGVAVLAFIAIQFYL